MAEPMIVPDLIEPFIAWRVWDVTLDDGELALSSVHHIDRWQPGQRMEARCRYWEHRGCVAPCEAGTHLSFAHISATDCGIHAAKTFERAGDYLPPSLSDPRALTLHKTRAVIGRVALSGLVREHEHGYRAQFASVVDVYVPVSFALLDAWGQHEIGPEPACHRLRERYGVPVGMFRRLCELEDVAVAA